MSPTRRMPTRPLSSLFDGLSGLFRAAARTLWRPRRGRVLRAVSQTHTAGRAVEKLTSSSSSRV